jgi:hypothetical protein
MGRRIWQTGRACEGSALADDERTQATGELRWQTHRLGKERDLIDRGLVEPHRILGEGVADRFQCQAALVGVDQLLDEPDVGRRQPVLERGKQPAKSLLSST